MCNSVCKLCNRFKTDEKVGSQLTRKQIDNLLTPVILKELHHVTVCGNTGEPTLGKNLIYLIRKLDELKNSVSLHIHTNGDTHPENWWRDLAKMYGRLQVTFSMDGLTNETHQLYRSTNRDRVFRNMMAFKNAGGNARWQFIIFNHNQHEVDDLRRIAKENDVELLIVKSRMYTDELQEPTINVDDSKTCGSAAWRDISMEERKTEPVCLWYKHEFFVRPDGELRSCCYRDYPVTRGLNLSDHKAEDILNSTEFRVVIQTIGVSPNCKKHCNEVNEDPIVQRLGQKLMEEYEKGNDVELLLRIGENG
jgi:MoaA/NifB/PqqE/SkfB family radical SAM enzyme